MSTTVRSFVNRYAHDALNRRGEERRGGRKEEDVIQRETKTEADNMKCIILYIYV